MPGLAARSMSSPRNPYLVAAPSGCTAPSRFSAHPHEKARSPKPHSTRHEACVDDLVESSPRRFVLKDEQVTELLYQALETEMGGVKIYETALKCAVNPDLKK